MIKDDLLFRKCQKLRPLIAEKADHLWLAYITSETLKARLEAETLIEMSWVQTFGKRIDQQQILLSLPESTNQRGQYPIGSVFYGTKSQGEVALRDTDLVKHMGIFAITGSGKTVTCHHLIKGLIQQKKPFLVIDWKRAYRRLQTQFPNLHVFGIGHKDVTPLNWNPLQPPPGVHPDTWISIVADSLDRSHLSGPGTADIFIQTFCQLFDQSPDTLPTFKEALMLVTSRPERGRRMLWRDTCMRILRSFCLGSAADALNPKSPRPFESLLKLPCILEIDYELPKQIRVFLSDIILRWVHLYRLREGETNSLRHVLFLEEAHNLFPRGHDPHATTSIETLLREVRSFGQGLVIISQHPSMMPTFVLGNTNTLLFLGLQHEDDIRAATRALFLPSEDSFILDQLKVGEGILKVKGRISPCFVRINAP